MAFRYTVVPGDTQTGIATRFHKMWMEIYTHPLNSEYRMKHTCSTDVFPGEVLLIPHMSESLTHLPKPSFEIKYKIDALKQPTKWACVYTCMVMLHRSYSYQKFITHQPSDIEAMLFPDRKYAYTIKGAEGRNDEKIPFIVQPEVKDHVKGKWFNEELDDLSLQVIREKINRSGSNYGRIGLLEIDKILNRYGISKSVIDCNGKGFKEILSKFGPFIWVRPAHVIVVYGLKDQYHLCVHFIDPEKGKPEEVDFCYFLQLHRPAFGQFGGKVDVYHM